LLGHEHLETEVPFTGLQIHPVVAAVLNAQTGALGIKELTLEDKQHLHLD
jgi:hypothetical protein